MSDNDKKESWGYASYDIDKEDDYSDNNLQYTRYESSGSVNRYVANEDGGHGHDYYSSANSYNLGGDPEYSRSESNSSENPSIGEVQNGSGCYLTSACIKNLKKDFDDNCEELRILRWFRDNLVSSEDVNHYYKIAPIIVDAINLSDDCDETYREIYNSVILACINDIKHGEYQNAYDRYKNSVVELEKKYVGEVSSGQRLVLTSSTN